jgi:flagellar biosynthesis protein FliR
VFKGLNQIIKGLFLFNLPLLAYVLLELILYAVVNKFVNRANIFFCCGTVTLGGSWPRHS